MTEWRPCADFPTYEVSRSGEVRRLITVRGKAPRILKPWDNGVGYAKVRLVDVKGVWRKVYVHRLVGKAFMGLEDGLEIDHRLHDLKDSADMRVVSRAQNARNSRGWPDHSSRYKGVSWDQKRRRWYACINVDRRTQALGRFQSEIAAARAYDRAAFAAWGEYAFLNFPREITG